ncbi:hypothetical protein GCM10023322_80210 [Rugosimonospora acidiphila]|uniref:HTH tetR-type domain-containing protein n=1 Tax=Rugosimonospora acidiphila TaxID=556531 RepID=A0ABP9STJ9_9ACTN
MMREVAEQDLTGRARLRRVAMRLFAEQGFEATSVRVVAAEAGVSPALIAHHFGSKQQLRAAVDDEVLATVGDALTAVDIELPVPRLMAELGGATARLFGADEDVRRYVRRALLEDSETGRTLFTRLGDGAGRVLERLSAAGVVRADADPDWARFQLLLLVLGPLLLEPLLPADAFEPAVLARRSAANQRLLRHGLFHER